MNRSGVEIRTYPDATSAQIASFRQHGYLVLEQVVAPNDLDELERHCDTVIDRKETLAFDWAWDEKETRETRSFRIVQSTPSLVWPEIRDAAFRGWAVRFGSALLGTELEFWYDQLLAKPPGTSVATDWHQDEGYWGRNLDDRGLTCWIPLQDVDVSNGCMHFVDGGHTDGVLPHRLVEGVQSDLLRCDPDESRAFACPLARGGVTFHHSKTPHMTTANVSRTWRKALSQHMRAKGCPGEGDHYPWKVYVNQFTGQRIIPDRR